MLNQADELFIQPYSGVKYYNKRYDILINKETALRITDMKPNKWLDTLYLINIFFNIPHYNRLNVQIQNENNDVIGYIIKEGGFFKMKDFHLFNAEKELIATIKAESKLSKLRLTILRNESEWGYSEGSLTAMDFSIMDSQTKETITVLRKRSPIYETVQENIEKGMDGYYVKTADSLEETLIRIACAISIDQHYN